MLKIRVHTGITGLDDMLYGGLPPGRVILLSGSSGTGKTTIGMQFIYNGIKKYDEPGVFVTLEQNKHKLVEDMLAVGMDVKKLGKNFTLVGGPIAEVLRIQNKVKAGVNDFILEIEEIVKETKAKRIVVDSVNLFLMLLKTDEERRNALLALSNLLSELGCTAILTCEVKENTYEISWYGFEEFVVDGVITLYNMRNQDVFTQGIAVRKMRGIKHKKNVSPYKIEKNGVTVYPDQPLFGKDAFE